MIEVYQWATAGKPKLIAVYDNLDHLIQTNYKGDIDTQYGNNHAEYKSYGYWPSDKHYTKVVYEDGKLVPHDVLVGAARKRAQDEYVTFDEYWAARRMRWMRGRRRPVYGSFRKPRIHQLRKAIDSVCEYEPKIRDHVVTNVREMSDIWCDARPSHNERNWKRHRKTQWK